MESATYQVMILCGIALWIVISSKLNVTRRLRSITQPWVTRYVVSGTRTILRIQKFQSRYLDALFSGLSCVVSVPFYTAFLPLLFWTGHCKLARQMTLLMAFCDYMGNTIKDVVSAPRPSSPPVRRVTATKDEAENAMEYGLPSSHTLNTVCLAGYLVHYILDYTGANHALTEIECIALACLVIGVIGFARMYLGMHSLIDIVGGLLLGLGFLALWLSVSEYLDAFIVSGENVISFWAVLCFLFLFAYPTPEIPTPSFEFHTAFNGVALGIVIGVHQTYHLFHHEAVPRIFSPQLTASMLAGRLVVGIPTILAVKFCSKALAKWALPVLAITFGIPVTSTSYLPWLNSMAAEKKQNETKRPGYLRKVFILSKQTSLNVDTGIRLLQYAGLAWSVVDLVPSLFAQIGL